MIRKEAGLDELEPLEVGINCGFLRPAGSLCKLPGVAALAPALFSLGWSDVFRTTPGFLLSTAGCSQIQ